MVLKWFCYQQEVHAHVYLGMSIHSIPKIFHIYYVYKYFSELRSKYNPPTILYMSESRAAATTYLIIK